MPVTTLAQPVSVASQRRSTERGFRRVLVVFSVVAAIGVLCHIGLMLWAQNSFTGPECVVGAQSMMLAHDGTLYYDLNRYPYTVSAYTPLFYLVEAALVKIGLPAYTSGRLVSFAALMGIVALVWRVVLLYTRDRYSSWLGTLMAGSSTLLLSWGTVGQVDTLAVSCALAAFYQFSRYLLRGENTLKWAGLFAVLAFFTKQTMIACPVAICIALLLYRPKVAFQFGATLAAVVGIIALSINVALSGRFLADTVLANLNPYSVEKILQHLKFAVFSSGPLWLIALLGARRAARVGGRVPFLYLGVAVGLLLGTAPKIGSDLNYQIESTVLLIICACLALHALDFFRLSFRGSKTWITLLQLPVAVFLVVNFRITARDLLTRVGGERLARSEVAAVTPYLADGGRVLSSDYNALVRLRGRMDLEMLVYRLLVDARVVDPEPVRRDIAAGEFSTILLMEDVNHRGNGLNIELATLPDVQIDEVRRRYRLVAKIPGSDVYVYKPVGQASGLSGQAGGMPNGEATQ